MRVLLDTCALIDLVGEPDRVADRVRDLLARRSTELFVSSASAWDVAIETERGRFPNGHVLVDGWAEHLDVIRAEELVITHADALAAGSLNWAHRDPFDRMLVAQAIRTGCQLATRDRTILAANLTATIDTTA